QYLTRMPIGGWIDPYLAFGGGAYHRSLSGTRFAASPGFGVRIPIPNRSELRLEAHEQLIFENGIDHQPVVEEHRLLFQTGFGFTARPGARRFGLGSSRHAVPTANGIASPVYA